MVLFTHVLVMLIGSWFSEVALPLTVLCAVCNARKTVFGKEISRFKLLLKSKRKENMKFRLPGMRYMKFSSK